VKSTGERERDNGNLELGMQSFRFKRHFTNTKPAALRSKQKKNQGNFAKWNLDCSS